jgi:hypothetical protein
LIPLAPFRQNSLGSFHLRHLAFCAAFAIGCGGGTDPTVPAVTPTPAEAVAKCSGAWQTFRAEAPYPAPKALAMGGDRIAFEALVEPGNVHAIQSVSTADGTEQTVVKDIPYSLWAEQDTVLYTTYRKLFSVPMGGGEPTLLVDFSNEARDLDFSFTQALDESFLYWMSSGDFSLARVPRSGGAVQTFAAPSTDILEGIALAPDAIVAANGQHGFAVPLTPGAVRPLADSGGSFAGVDASGAYFYRLAQPFTIPVERHELVRAPADGGALETIWTPPAHQMPHRVWPDGQGGWVVASLGKFDDGKEHAGVWFVSATGEARLAACDPLADDDTGYIVARPALSKDTAYFAVENVYKATWSVIKVAR